MTAIELPRAPGSPANPTFAEELDETFPLVGVAPVYGPPVVLLAVPWLLLSLTLAGPFALLETVLLLLVVVAVLIGLIGAVLASPILLVRHLRAHRAARAPMRAPATRLESRWGAA